MPEIPDVHGPHAEPPMLDHVRRRTSSAPPPDSSSRRSCTARRADPHGDQRRACASVSAWCASPC
jgi:hypothetical protein